jgi:predicted HTH domain antitoxin
MGLDEDGLLQATVVRAALATALFRDGELSLVRAAHVAGLDVSSFISHFSRLGIPAIRLSEAENTALDTLEQWLQSSSPTPPADRLGQCRRAGLAAGGVHLLLVYRDRVEIGGIATSSASCWQPKSH